MKSLLFLICLALFGCGDNPPLKTLSAAPDTWIRDSTAQFTLQAQKGVRAENDLKAIGRRLEQTQSELLHLLKEDSPQRLQLYFLKDRKTLTSYTGFPANGYTDTENGIIYFVDKAPFHLAFRHEMMHALSWRLWGPPHGYWLSEGLAVFASKGCGGYPLHTLARAIQQEGKLTPFENMKDTFDFRAIEPSLQSASMVQYLYETYGLAALKSVWKAGWKKAEQAIGVPAGKLERGWLACIRQPKYSAVVRWSDLRTSGCE